MKRQTQYYKYISLGNTLMGVLMCLVLTSVKAENASIDGRLDESFWSDAEEYGDFRITQPFLLKAPEHETRAMVYAGEKGLYIGFYNVQQSESSLSHVTLRDEEILDDHNEVIVDFDGNGSRAYGFKVSRVNAIQDSVWQNETREALDWDGDWEHATYIADDYWSTEIFLPWSIVPMQAQTNEGRTISVYLSRWYKNTRQRYSFPATDRSQRLFVSHFNVIKMNPPEAHTVDFFPYFTANRDTLRHQTTSNMGLDIFWQPSSNKQLNLTLNPDFGQVESNELVVNFSAIEDLFTEKRPFFRENHEIFDLQGPGNLRVVHTPRVGGAPDKGNQESSDIDAAVSFIQLGEKWEFGGLVAEEADSDESKGRMFSVGRVNLVTDYSSIGFTYTHTKHSESDRQADVAVIDAYSELGEQFLVSGQLLRSSISNLKNSSGENEVEGSSFSDSDLSDTGWWLTGEYYPVDIWSHTLTLYHYGKNMDVNDFGFSDRANIRKIAYGSDYEWPDVQYFNVSDIGLEFDLSVAQNEQGERLPLDTLTTFVATTNDNEEWELELGYQSSGYDDLLTRGHYSVEIPATTLGKMSYKTNQSNRLRLDMSVAGGTSGLKGNWQEYEFVPSYQFGEFLYGEFEFVYHHSDSWLLWLEDDEDPNLVGEFEQHSFELALNMAARFQEKHELRIRWESVAIKARALKVFEATSNGDLVATDEEPEHFSTGEFATQVRYRYELGALSELFLVYSRGGELEVEDVQHSTSQLINQSKNRADQEHVLLKIKLHF